MCLADKCVFQVMSINKSMSSNKKLLSLVKLVKLFVSCIQKCYPSKNFRGSVPNPAGSTPPPPPRPHLQSTSIHRWLRPCFMFGHLYLQQKEQEYLIKCGALSLLICGRISCVNERNEKISRCDAFSEFMNNINTDEVKQQWR